MYSELLNFDVYNIDKRCVGRVFDFIFVSELFFLIIINEYGKVFVPYVKYKYIISVNFFKNYLIISC